VAFASRSREGDTKTITNTVKNCDGRTHVEICIPNFVTSFTSGSPGTTAVLAAVDYIFAEHSRDDARRDRGGEEGVMFRVKLPLRHKVFLERVGHDITRLFAAAYVALPAKEMWKCFVSEKHPCYHLQGALVTRGQYFVKEGKNGKSARKLDKSDLDKQRFFSRR
jgi:hypothetical protein